MGAEISERYMEALAEAGRYSYLGRFIQGLIHNINGPLQNLSMLGEILEKSTERLQQVCASHPGDASALFDKQRERLRQMQEQVSALSEMLRDFMLLRDVEDVEADGDPKIVLPLVLRIFRSDLFFKHKVETTLEMEATTPVVPLPGRLLCSAVLEMIGNGIDAMRDAPERRLTVSCGPCEGGVAIRVRDTGVGLGSVEEGERAFEPLYSNWPESLVARVPGRRPIGFGLYDLRCKLAPFGASLTLQPRDPGAEVTLFVPSRT